MRRYLLLLILLLSACQSDRLQPTASTAPQLPTYFPTIVEGKSEPRTPRAKQVTPLPIETTAPPTFTFTPFSTPSSYEQYTVEALRSRTYGAGEIEVTDTLEQTDAFTRYLIRYPSDGLSITGFANVPHGDGPFAVIIAVHGLVKRADYQTLDYTTSAVDGLTRAGYIVIHPDMRGYPPSDDGDNLFRVGMTVDLLNLVALVKSQAGPAELFAHAATDHIGLWGHSMGGDIILRALTISRDIKAAVLFSSISGDELKNAQLLFDLTHDPIFQAELAVPPDIVKGISPLYYYKDITTPIQLHHGTADQTVPLSWAEESCMALSAARVQSECLYYPGEDHTFRSRVANQVGSAMLDFYARYLSP